MMGPFAAVQAFLAVVFSCFFFVLSWYVRSFVVSLPSPVVRYNPFGGGPLAARFGACLLALISVVASENQSMRSLSRCPLNRTAAHPNIYAADPYVSQPWRAAVWKCCDAAEESRRDDGRRGSSAEHSQEEGAGGARKRKVN